MTVPRQSRSPQPSRADRSLEHIPGLVLTTCTVGRPGFRSEELEASSPACCLRFRLKSADEQLDLLAVTPEEPSSLTCY